MEFDEAKRIVEDFGTNYLDCKQLQTAVPSSKRKAVENDLLDLAEGESIDGLCILVCGTVDKLPNTS